MSEMLVIPKAWGVVQRLFESPSFVFDRAQFFAGYCSLHEHIGQWNRFYVRSGRILIAVVIGSYGPTGDWLFAEVGPGSSFDVPPKTLHRFVVLEPGIMWESYWPTIGYCASPEDIRRIEGEDSGTDFEALTNHEFRRRILASCPRLRNAARRTA